MRRQLLIFFLGVTFSAGLSIDTFAKTVFEGLVKAEEGTFNLLGNASLASGVVEFDSTGDSCEWHQFLVSNPEKILLGGGKTYIISYDYVVN